MARYKPTYIADLFVFYTLGFLTTIPVIVNSNYVCEHEKWPLYMACEPGRFIQIASALYGRQDNSICPGSADHITSCAAENALSIVQNKCTGRQSCEVDASNSLFGDPCPGTRKYLQVDFYCVKGTCQQHHTPSEYGYTFLGPRIPKDAARFDFKVRASNDAHIALTNQPFDTDSVPSDFIEIVLGGMSNDISFIRNCMQCGAVTGKRPTPDLLSVTEDRHFLISYQNSFVEVSIVGEPEPFMSYQFENLDINYIGISTGWGSTGNWTFCNYVPTAVYLGCFVDSSHRALPNHLIDNHEDMTVEKCLAHCRSFGDQKYASMQYSYQCFCGDAMTNYSMYGQADQLECNSGCSGRGDQFCGGGWRNSVYDLGVSKNIRLVGTTSLDNSYSGRVELYHDGSWSTVCGLGWDLVDADVACKAVGYPGAAESYTNADMFGPGTGNIILSDVNCVGIESDLFECGHWNAYYVTGGCSHTDDVAVVCRQWAGDNGNNKGSQMSTGTKLGIAAGWLCGFFMLCYFHSRWTQRRRQNRQARPPPTTNVPQNADNALPLPSYEAATESNSSSIHGFPDVIPPYHPDTYDVSALNDPDLPPPPSYDTVVKESDDYQLDER